MGLIGGMAMLLSGCASTSMKGTPFYTGEYERREGAATDRVNLWPLLYYRAPALSVLWPIGEWTDQHVAVRPLFSVSGLDQPPRQVSLLWPLARFETSGDRGYMFPVYWEPDSLTVFPLYWHAGDPFGEAGGYNTLFPLWSHYRSPKGATSTHAPWPIWHRSDLPERKGWRLWPLYGQYAKPDGTRRFYAWPLGWQWRHEGDGGHMVIPFYYADRDATQRQFYSLPYSRVARADGSGWRLTIPLGYERHAPDAHTVATLLGGYRRDGDSSGWFALPLLSGGSRDADGGSLWVLGPLAHAAWSENARRHHVVPLYHRASHPDSETLISLPWSDVARADGSGWQLAPPVYYRQWSTNGSALITPLYAHGATADGQTTWRGFLPLYFGRTGPDDRLLATPLGGFSREDDRTSWVAVPALATGHHTPDGSEVWAGAGLFHRTTGSAGQGHHLLPVYYWNGESGTFISLPVARQRNAERTRTVIPPLLSWKTERPARRDWWVAGPLAHFSAGPERGSSHVLPLYYHAGDDERRLTPLYMRFGKHDERTLVWPPLLSAYHRDGDDRQCLVALGLGRHAWDPEGSQAGHLFPFYAFKNNKYVLTPLAGRQTGNEGFVYPLTPLAGWYTGAYTGGWFFPFGSRKQNIHSGRVTGDLLWGEYWREGHERGGSLFPLYSYRGHAPLAAAEASDQAGTFGRRLNVLGLYQSKALMTRRTPGAGEPLQARYHRQSRLFPLWSWNARTEPARGTERREGTLLLALADYQRVTREGTSPLDYTRARVLWRLWHYERDHDEISLDVFPAITVDRNANGDRKVSFLWRAFRYQTEGDRREIDLLFLPVWRAGAHSKDAPSRDL